MFISIILNNFLGQIGKIGLGAAVLTFSALTIFWAVRLYGQEKSSFKFAQLIDLLDFFIISVTIVVVAVPEGFYYCYYYYCSVLMVF